MVAIGGISHQSRALVLFNRDGGPIGPCTGQAMFGGKEGFQGDALLQEKVDIALQGGASSASIGQEAHSFSSETGKEGRVRHQNINTQADHRQGHKW